uniref:Uncharacterized protein n=1 Tax=Magnetococcus massalia (strain MO-1) TaxID=451514 RepID=A0A1S7LCX2_MAGMO|nr:conserved protein of unknown function [Candidatus Magnetococcus massalia]
MTQTVVATKLGHDDTLTISGPGEVKIMASKKVAILKGSSLSLPSLAATAKPTLLGLKLMGPAMGLLGVTLAMAYLAKMAGDAINKQNNS